MVQKTSQTSSLHNLKLSDVDVERKYIQKDTRFIFEISMLENYKRGVLILF
jgi:hypothetical protein